MSVLRPPGSGRAAQPRPTGVFGGTFNPVHLAHLCVAEEVVEALRLSRMLFVPSATPPHKSDAVSDPIAPAELRLAWLREALADNPRFEVDPLEIERGGTSYMVHTLEALASRLEARPVFVIGWDAFSEIDAWREPARLFELADFAVLTRPPVLDPSLRSSLPSCIRGVARVADDGRSARLADGEGWIRLVPVTPLGVSASGIRARLREGRTVRYLLPEGVHDAIVKSGVYGPSAPPTGSQEER